MSQSNNHTFKFFRAGGFDQVRLDTAADLLALKALDQKLWVALACPTRGVEFDARTLQSIDSDGDGFIRPPELIAAIEWAAARLADVSVLAQQQDGVPLVAIANSETTAALRAAAARILDGKHTVVTVAAACAAEAEFAAQATAAWQAAGAAACPVGADGQTLSLDASAAAYSAANAVGGKIDDFFVRCRLAGFDERAAAALNVSDETFGQLSPQLLTLNAAAVAAMPLAKVGAGGTVPLVTPAVLNPAWADAIAALNRTALIPLLGEREALTEADWRALQQQLAPFAAWQSSAPHESPEAAAVRDLERLARYVRDLLPLANNMVAFRDFYTHQGKAIFQIGTLYLDGRSAELCVAVNDAARHVTLAGLSGIYLIYCDCTRGAEKISIAAAFTEGDADELIVGRNGVFYDRQGRDWNATITKIVDNPISLRQAFWSPYKRLMRMVSEQLQKFVGARAESADAMLGHAATHVAASADKPGAKSPAATAFDVGKFAGIFAAIGLAIGAIGTALATLIAGLLGLKWWQIPLALFGLMLAISGPSMLLAAFKLRKRSLGPILDANGWAVNARARVNIPFGTSLTQLAELPDDAECSLVDPYAEKQPPWRLYGLVALVAFVALAWWTH